VSAAKQYYFVGKKELAQQFELKKSISNLTTMPTQSYLECLQHNTSCHKTFLHVKQEIFMTGFEFNFRLNITRMQEKECVKACP